jgi:hypothetical protein
MQEYKFLIIIDILCLIASIILLKRNLSFFHPGFIYLFFHVYSFTLRLWELSFGAIPLYGDLLGFSTVTNKEIFRAMIWADIGLLFFSLGSLFAFKVRLNKSIKGLIFNIKKVWMLAVLFFIVGLPSFFLQQDISSFGMSTTRQFILLMSLWPVSALIALIYVMGFRWYLMLALIPFLFVFSTQGYHRFMVILPVILLVSIYLSKSNLKWPNKRIMIILLSAALIFPQLKYIGMAYTSNDPGEVTLRLKQAFHLEKSDSSTINSFLDQYAGALTLIDNNDKFYYGSTYLKVFIIFIPRAIWPSKPGLADHTVALGTSERPYDVEGRIITYLGEAYINFRYFGFFIVPTLVGYFLTRFYRSSVQLGYGYVQHYIYLVFMAVLIQVYRDGLVSIVLFGVFQNLLMVTIYLAHKFSWNRR